MPDFRRDPVSQRWVILARNRADRPDEFQHEPGGAASADCPFCPGQEHRTPRPVAAYGVATGAPEPWQVRVVPNLYPALVPDVEAWQTHDGLYEAAAGRGVHEVIIESPRHVRSLSELSDLQAELTVRAYRDRLRWYCREPQLAGGILFKNVGRSAGASLVHAHSQLLILPDVPITLQQELDGAQRFYQQHRDCVFCAMVRRELEGGQCLVRRTDRFAALCPFASRFACETWILPVEHQPHFELLPDDMLAELAQLLREIIVRLERLFGQPDYNYWLHSAPFDMRSPDHYHWHLEIFPRKVHVAGFEWGTGVHINPVPPEEAAAKLRSVALPESLQSA